MAKMLILLLADVYEYSQPLDWKVSFSLYAQQHCLAVTVFMVL